MKDTEAFERIEPAVFDAVFQEYSNVVPQKVFHLDDQRYNIIPTAVKNREEDVSLSKEEVATLVDWKLYVPSINHLRSFLRDVSTLRLPQ